MFLGFIIFYLTRFALYLNNSHSAAGLLFLLNFSIFCFLFFLGFLFKEISIFLKKLYFFKKTLFF
ncbi:MAG: hypothetical protein BWY48_00082 [Parcubacteria group bacterium ADurb.Bin305]|nr:MAG: hypothetical protein BWY48_00082 [Parcubacteria group bacterium ADurb.Bin305]